MTSTPEEINAQAIRDHLYDSVVTMQLTLAQCVPDITRAARMLAETFEAGNQVFICGNGGSAADASHMAAELIAAGLPATALTTDTSVITATANDFGYQFVFSKQLESLAVEGDLLVAISTSGRSRNVLAAVDYALANKIQVVALTGKEGFDAVLDDCLTIKVPSTETSHIQECHLPIEHVICELVTKAMDA